MAVLSRQDMERVIREGGSVLHLGRVISRIEGLPAEAELAKGDPAQEAAVAQSLGAQIAALQAQLDELKGAGSTPESSTAVTAKDDLEEIGLSTDVADRLRAAGLTTRAKLAATDDVTLLEIDGVGEATLKKIRERG